MVITLDSNTLAGEVKRSLSIIGKRSVDDKGEPAYKDITLGSLEDPLLADYFRQAVIDISTETAAFITAASDTQITLTFPTNHNTVLETFIQQSCEAYCVSYALWSWLTITAPRIASRYLEDCKRQIGSIIRLIHDKKSPTAAASSPLDISTSIT